MEMFRRIRRSRELRQRLEHSRDRLYRVAYAWCHDRYLADDLVQQTMVKALQNAGQLRELAVAETWLFRILSNCWRDHFRRQRETVEVDDATHWHELTPEAEHGRDQIVTRVRAAIAKLAPSQREVITLIDLGGLSYMEVAEVLQIPIGTVMSRVCRGRRALKEQLLDIGPNLDRAPPRLRRVK